MQAINNTKPHYDPEICRSTGCKLASDLKSRGATFGSSLGPNWFSVQRNADRSGQLLNCITLNSCCVGRASNLELHHISNEQGSFFRQWSYNIIINANINNITWQWTSIWFLPDGARCRWWKSFKWSSVLQLHFVWNWFGDVSRCSNDDLPKRAFIKIHICNHLTHLINRESDGHKSRVY